MDDELNRLLVNPLAPGVRLHAIIDACHSGTALDLEYRCKVKSSGLHWKREYARQPRMYKVRAACILCLSQMLGNDTTEPGCSCMLMSRMHARLGWLWEAYTDPAYQIAAI